MKQDELQLRVTATIRIGSGYCVLDVVQVRQPQVNELHVTVQVPAGLEKALAKSILKGKIVLV